MQLLSTPPFPSHTCSSMKCSKVGNAHQVRLAFVLVQVHHLDGDCCAFGRTITLVDLHII